MLSFSKKRGFENLKQKRSTEVQSLRSAAPEEAPAPWMLEAPLLHFVAGSIFKLGSAFSSKRSFENQEES